MKIKIIDLLNKIANDEKVPEKIKIKNVIYEYRGYMYCTEKANYQDIEDYLFGKWNFNILNDYAEIIEEPKKIEKIEPVRGSDLSDLTDKDMVLRNNALVELCKTLNNINNKVNELIDEINNLKEK